MANPVKSYQRRINGKLVTVSPYSRKDPTGRAGVGGPNPGQTRTAKKASSDPRSAKNNYQSPEWLKSQVQNLEKFEKGPQLDSTLEAIVRSPKLGGIVIFPSEEIRQYALQFAKSKGLTEVWGVPIQKLFVLAKDEPAARATLYDALRKQVVINKAKLEKKLKK